MRSVELTVIVQDENNVRARNQDGAEKSCKIEQDRLSHNTIEIFQEWLNLSKISRRRELEVLGMHLYRMLFSGEVETFFEETRKSVPAGERLRVQLSFQEAVSHLASLPWEYLYCPDTETRKGFFLSTDADLVLSRYMPIDKGRQPLGPGVSPLRILMVVSQPTNLAPVIAGPVIEVIEKLPDVKVESLDTPTVENFVDKLKETKPHVLHFIGHGRFYKAERKGEIALLGPDEKSERWIGDNEFTDYFRQAGWTPRLVFLHLCEGATVDFNASFAGLAPPLIRANIPAVVAMQYPITNKAAIAFSKTFYRELASGAPIDHAVQSGRWRITADVPDAYNTRVFGAPVLYIQSGDGVILPSVRVEPDPGLDEKQMDPGRAKPLVESIVAKPSDSDAEKKPTWMELNQLFYEGETRLDQAGLLEAQKEAIKAELFLIRSEMKERSSSDWKGIVLNYYYEKQDRDLRAVLKILLDHLRQ